MKEVGANLWRTRARLTARQRRWAQMLDAVEPGLTLADLAARLKQPYATVQRWTAFFGYPILDGRRQRAARVDWRPIDWRKTNIEIARELGVSRERVRQVRRTAGIAPVDTTAQRFRRFVLARLGQLRATTVRGAIEASGLQVSYEVARQILRKAGIKPFKRKVEPLPFDWRLPTRDLARIYERSEQQIANLRFRTSAGPARWDLRGGRALKEAGYRAALKKEKQRASRRQAWESKTGAAGAASNNGGIVQRKPSNRRRQGTERDRTEAACKQDRTGASARSK